MLHAVKIHTWYDVNAGRIVGPLSFSAKQLIVKVMNISFLGSSFQSYKRKRD
jgi:hypothetical protein